MNVTADELAGVVDLFGGLTREELERALAEAAFRADGGEIDEDVLGDAIEEALAAFALVRYDGATADADDGATTDGGEPLLVAGPTAFPRVPDGAEDVPHILDVERRRLDREALGHAVRERFEVAVSDALEAERDPDRDDRLRRLLEVSYDVEAWAPVDVGAERARLEAAIEAG